VLSDGGVEMDPIQAASSKLNSGGGRTLVFDIRRGKHGWIDIPVPLGHPTKPTDLAGNLCIDHAAGCGPSNDLIGSCVNGDGVDVNRYVIISHKRERLVAWWTAGFLPLHSKLQ